MLKIFFKINGKLTFDCSLYPLGVLRETEFCVSGYVGEYVGMR